MHRGPSEGAQSLDRMTRRVSSWPVFLTRFAGSNQSCFDVPLEMKGLGNWQLNFLVSAEWLS